jgi:peptidyl-dipeptidase Dcp
MTGNPFFESWTTPFGMPPLDRIRPEHFPPAFDRGMHEQIAEIAAITSSAAPPSFADTIEALERSGRLLERVSRVFFNLDSSNTNDAIEAIARDYAPRLAQHQIRIALHPALFARIADLYARRASLGLDPDQLRLIERYHLRFVRSGAFLNPEQKERMAAISERLAACTRLSDRTCCTTSRIGNSSSPRRIWTASRALSKPRRRKPHRSAEWRAAMP